MLLSRSLFNNGTQHFFFHEEIDLLRRKICAAQDMDMTTHFAIRTVKNYEFVNIVSRKSRLTFPDSTKSKMIRQF